MTSDPDAPGAPAIILYREVFRDDMGRKYENGVPTVTFDYSNTNPREDNYFRIKILTEEGRKYADVEIPFFKEAGRVSEIHARTIKPDGTIVDFDGQVYTKSLVKGRGVKYLAKTFTLPAVEAGCIIEYYYSVELSTEYLVNSNWILGNELFTKSADFGFNAFVSPDLPYGVRWTWENLPAGASPITRGTDNVVRMHVSNIPAFPTEDFMPPENALKGLVEFTYPQDAPEADPSRFWAKVSKRMYGRLESFLGKPKALEGAVGEIVGPNDPPEVKLQKLYARVQQMRNTTYEPQKTEQEEKRAKEKPPNNVEEVWKRGSGDSMSLTWLYLALVRAAGFDAYGIMAADRSHYFFDPTLMQSRKVSSNLILIKLNGKNIFCDPGSALTPYGLLPWPETGIQGLQLDKKELIWITTLTPTSDQARTERRADLTLTETGDLEGKLTVTYTGMEGARVRVEERNSDEAERKKFLEDAVKGFIPAASEVKLTKPPEWKNSALPFTAEFDIKVPGWASGAGHHFLVPVGLFGGNQKHLFDHAYRIYPIYFQYPFQESDEINIQLPTGWQIASLPAGWNDTGKVVTYTLAAQNQNGKLHLARTLSVNTIFLEQKYYGALRNYFQQIKTTDDEQVVLDAWPGAGGELTKMAVGGGQQAPGTKRRCGPAG